MTDTVWLKRSLGYEDWIARFDTLSARDRRAIHAHIARFARRPRLHLLVTAEGAEPAAIAATLASLRAQFYRDYTCTVLGGAATAPADVPDAEEPPVTSVPPGRVAGWLAEFNATLGVGLAADWVMLLRAADTLAAHALYWYAWEILARPSASVVYSDDDHLDAHGRRCDPRFK